MRRRSRCSPPGATVTSTAELPCSATPTAGRLMLHSRFRTCPPLDHAHMMRRSQARHKGPRPYAFAAAVFTLPNGFATGFGASRSGGARVGGDARRGAARVKREPAARRGEGRELAWSSTRVGVRRTTRRLLRAAFTAGRERLPARSARPTKRRAAPRSRPCERFSGASCPGWSPLSPCLIKVSRPRFEARRPDPT